ncbi:CLUMA_CG018371, isoform A [Clunio marinus]|uniref:CLUMA_CG018371, isoform A n=1 Tax=Clunio marinus TaxID=568069 RepID=A0A1J1IYX9_9DIPT|nr:CLUMA_CG018371, isoform A [Clunio marinus]
MQAHQSGTQSFESNNSFGNLWINYAILEALTWFEYLSMSFICTCKEQKTQRTKTEEEIKKIIQETMDWYLKNKFSSPSSSLITLCHHA